MESAARVAADPAVPATGGNGGTGTGGIGGARGCGRRRHGSRTVQRRHRHVHRHHGELHGQSGDWRIRRQRRGRGLAWAVTGGRRRCQWDTLIGGKGGAGGGGKVAPAGPAVQPWAVRLTTRRQVC